MEAPIVYEVHGIAMAPIEAGAIRDLSPLAVVAWLNEALPDKRAQLIELHGQPSKDALYLIVVSPETGTVVGALRHSYIN